MATLTDVARTSQDVFLNANKDDTQTANLRFNQLTDNSSNYFIKSWSSPDWGTYLELSTNSGGFVQLFGNDSTFNAGVARLRSTDHSTYWYDLDVRPDGNLTFSGYDVVRIHARWNDGTNWYRLYHDGFLEQGGTIFYPHTSGGYIWLTYPKPFLNASIYDIEATGYRHDSNPWQAFVSMRDWSNTGVNVCLFDDTTSNPGYIRWHASGYAW